MSAASAPPPPHRPGPLPRRAPGFSLLEALVVLAILSALALLALPVAELTDVRAREKRLWQNLGEMRAAIDRYRSARDTVGAPFPPDPVFPPSVASLLEVMPARLARPNANRGPYLATGSLSNPFAPAEGAFHWDIRDVDVASDADDDWTSDVREMRTSFAGTGGVFDIRYPQGGVGGWKTAIDGSRYADW